MFNINKTILQKVGLGTLYIKGYLEGKEYIKYIEMYERYQFLMGGREFDKKNINDFRKKFNLLIDSFNSKGFDEKYPIIVSKEGIPIDGHHRVGCCLYFNKTPNYIINKEVSIQNYNGLDWILNNFFIANSYNIEEKIEIINEYKKYNKIYFYYTNPINNILGKIKFKIQNTKICVYITSSEIKKLSKENNDINTIFNSRDFSKLTDGKHEIYRKFNIYFYHTYNKVKRIVSEFKVVIYKKCKK